MTRAIALALALVALLAGARLGVAAPTREMDVLTSFSKELFEAYRQGFERKDTKAKASCGKAQDRADEAARMG